MFMTHRLEDFLPEWRGECVKTLELSATTLTDQAVAMLPSKVPAGDPKAMEAMTAAIAESVEQIAVDDLLPKCVEFLKSRDAISESLRLKPEAAVALRQRLPKLSPVLPAAQMQTPYLLWSLLAMGGAALGAMALTPLSTMLFDMREPGLFLGGILGAGGFVGLVAWLSERPKIRRTMEMIVTLAAGGSLLAGAFAFYKSRSSMPLRAGLWIGFCWLLLFFTRPRLTAPNREKCQEALLPQIRGKLEHAADLVLACVWHHPQREPKADLDRDGLNPGIADALSTLGAMNHDQSIPEKQLRGAVRSLLQRVREAGYEWQSIPDGTPFEPAFEERFDSFGIIEPGQPVETLEPARLLHGKPEKRGQLRARSRS